MRWGLSRAEAALWGVIVICALPYIGLGKYSLSPFHDNAEILIGALGAIAPGEGWFRHSTAGFDVAALGFASPFNLRLYHAVPPWMASQILILFQLICGTVGSYLLCRRVLGVSPVAALIPAAMQGALMDGRLVYSVIAAQPMLVVVTAWLADRPRSPLRWLGAAAFTLVFSQSGYVSFVVPWPAATVIAWFLFVDFRRKPLEWIAIAAVALGLIAVRLPELLALAAQAPLSHIGLLRGLPTVESILRWPEIVVGPLSLTVSALGVLGVMTLGRTDRRAIGALVLVILVVLGTMAVQIVQIWLTDLVPFIRGYNFSRLSFAMLPPWWLIASLGIQVLLDQTRPPHSPAARRLGQAALGMVAAVTLYGAGMQKAAQVEEWVSQGNYVSIFQSPVIRDLVPLTRAGPWPQRAEIFQSYPAPLQAYGLETAGGYHALYSRRYFEFWSAMVEPWMEAAADVPDADAWWRMPQRSKEDGGWPLFRGDRLMLSPHSHRGEQRLDAFYRLNLLSLANVGWVLSRDHLMDEGLERIGPAVPTAWSDLTTREKILAALKANFTGRTHLMVYRNPAAFPRFFSPRHIQVAATGRANLAAMAAASLDTLRDTLFAAAADLPASLDPAQIYAPVAIRPLGYGSDEIRLEVDAPQGGLLIGVNSYSPNWSCEIDGAAATLFPADHTFWGLVLPPGTRSVIFRYRR